MELTFGVLGSGASARRWSSVFLFAAAKFKTAGATPQATETQDAGADNRRRVLVVDDHVDTLRSMKLLLSRLGYHVLSAENMTDALRLAQDEPFDILLSDIALPDGSGLELIKRIRQTRDVLGLALSGFGMDEYVQRSRGAAFADHQINPGNYARMQAA